MSLLLARAAPAGGGVTLDDVTTRTGVQLPLLLTSGSFSNANGTVSAPGPLNGSLSVTLGSLTLTSDGDVPRTGTVAVTLGAVTVSATGTVRVSGTLSQTLGTLTAASTGTVRVAGTLSATLGALALSGTGAVTSGPTGTLAATLGALTAAGAGTVTGEGTAVQSAAGYYADFVRRQRLKRRQGRGRLLLPRRLRPLTLS
jgi:hypothetical protein